MHSPHPGPARCIVGLLLYGSVALADVGTEAGISPPPTQASSSPNEVRLEVRGPVSDQKQLALLLEELLGRLHARLVLEGDTNSFTSRENDPGLLALVRIELPPEGLATCTVEDSTGRTRMRRQLDMNGTSRAVLLEELAHVAHVAVETLLTETLLTETRTHGETAPAIAPVAPESPPPPEVLSSLARPASKPVVTMSGGVQVKAGAASGEAPFAVELGLFLGLHGVAESALFVPGAAATVVTSYRRSRLRPSLWLTAEYRLPFELDDSSLPPNAQTVALRALAALDFYRISTFAFGAALGGGIDVFTVHHGFEKENATFTELSRTQYSPVFSGFFSVRKQLVKNVELSSLFGVEFDLGETELEVRHKHRDTKPWPLRPGVMVGLSFSPFGQ